MKTQNKKQNSSQKNSKNILQAIIVALLILLIALVAYFGFFKNTGNNDEQVAVDTTQTEYVKPEEPVDRSKNVTLPGWGAFNIKANTTNITQGFEFHNPEENYWYVDKISINGKEIEDLVVDSGNKVELNHYLKLAGIKGEVKSVQKYDDTLFKIEKNKSGNYEIEAIGTFNDEKQITLTTTKGKKVTIDAKGKADCYYMTFGLFLTDGDEELYQSGLVAPGKYIQKMDMKKSLKKGTYDAYVVIQPYKSDKKTKTNSGVVNIKLNVQ